MDFQKLPPLDDSNESTENESKFLYKKDELTEDDLGKVDSGLPSLPSLDEDLEDLGGDEDLEDSAEDEDFEDSTEDEDFEDLTEDEDFEDLTEDEDFEDSTEDEDFEDLTEDEDFEDLSEDEDFEGSIEDEDFEDSTEDEDLTEDNFSFLPGMPQDEEANVESHSKPKDKKDSKHKELDDDAIRDYFVNLKNKILKPKSKSSNKGKQSKLKKTNPSIKVKTSKNPILNKIKKIVGVIVIILLVAALVLFALSKLGSQSKPLIEISHENKGEEVIVLMNNIQQVESGVKVNLENKGDISAKFLIDIEFSTEKSLFKKSNFTCKSDIVFIEVGSNVEELLICDNFTEAEKYSIDVNFAEIK